MQKNNFPVVGLLGKFNSGKGTAANLFADCGFKAMALADPIKQLLWEHFFVPRKELWGPSENRSERTRKMLQHLGTDFGRHFDPEVWIKKLHANIRWVHQKEQVKGIVVTDVRFPNEAQYLVDNMDALIIRIDRPDNNRYKDQALQKHSSETCIDEVPLHLIHAVITNSGTLADFKLNVKNTIRDITS